MSRETTARRRVGADMQDKYNLERFVKAQENSYSQALREMKNGIKSSHWMWYIFPQIEGLGRTETARFYSIHSMEEAKAYLAHPILGKNLREITAVLLEIESNDAERVMGFPDNLKLCSSMTLFSLADPDEAVFEAVLDKFYGGKKDRRTIEILQRGGV